MNAAIFLDRDNTLIANDGDLGDPAGVRLIDGVAAGLRELRDAGFELVVVTNQAGVARGAFTEDDVDAVHQRIAELVDEEARTRDVISRFYYCPYHPEAPIEAYRREHPWRKPHPGMILQAARDLDIDLGASWVIGDQARDVEAGRAAGCRTILVGKDRALALSVRPSAVAASFDEAVRAVLAGGAARGDHGGGPGAPGMARARGSGGAAKTGRAGESEPDDTVSLARAVRDLTDALRAERERRPEFTALRLAAALGQLLAVLFALLGVVQMDSGDALLRWFLAAGLVQLATIAILLFDLKG
jgi:D,D-heptose 1,7-bisphosphate phosphatase